LKNLELLSILLELPFIKEKRNVSGFCLINWIREISFQKGFGGLLGMAQNSRFTGNESFSEGY